MIRRTDPTDFKQIFLRFACYFIFLFVFLQRNQQIAYDDICIQSVLVCTHFLYNNNNEAFIFKDNCGMPLYFDMH